VKKPHGILLPILGVLGGISIIVALAILITVNHSRTALENYKAELEKRGETFDISRLMPSPPPAENNGADALVAAGDALKAAVTKNSIKPYQAGQLEASPGQAEIVHRRHAALRLRKDTTWEDFHKEMEPLRPLLKEIRRSASAPVLEIQPDYAKGISMPLPFLPPFLSSGQFLGAESVLLLRAGDTATATENIETTLRIAGVANRQPLLISRLVAVALAGICQATTWELLQANPSPQELQRVQKAWESFSLTAGIPAILRMERASCAPAFSSPLDILKSIASFSPASSASSSSLDDYTKTVEWTLWSVIFRYSDERHFIGYYQDLIARLERGDTWQSVLAAAQAHESSLSSSGISRKMSALSIPTNNNALAKFASQAALQSLTITAIAIRRYQLDHSGHPPEILADLMPGYVSVLPTDPMNNKPIRYQRKGEQFLLYATAENGVDDGGDATTISGKKRRGLTDGLDIVWPQAQPSPE